MMTKIKNSRLLVGAGAMLQFIGFVRIVVWIVKGVIGVIELVRGHRIVPRQAGPVANFETVFNTEAYQWLQLLRNAMAITVAIEWLLRKQRQAMAAANRGVFCQPWTIDARLGPAGTFSALSAEPLDAPVWTLHDETDVARTSSHWASTGRDTGASDRVCSERMSPVLIAS